MNLGLLIGQLLELSLGHLLALLEIIAEVGNHFIAFKSWFNPGH